MGRPRHPLVRLFVAGLALALLAVASVFVMFIAGTVLALWVARRAWLRLSPGAGAQRATPRVNDALDGEYRVVRPRSELLPR
jgi:membrane protein implicated in regulation of membrane protease activity